MLRNILVFAAILVALGGLVSPHAAHAQCATPMVVGYQPVAPAPTGLFGTGLFAGWYPGKMFDDWAARRAAYRGYATQAYAASYAPRTYAAYSRAVPMTTMQPVVGCDACTGTATTSYRPVTSWGCQTCYVPQRRAWHRPLFSQTSYAVPAASGCYSNCNTCSAALPLGSSGCATCATGQPSTQLGPTPADPNNPPAPELPNRQTRERPTPGPEGNTEANGAGLHGPHFPRPLAHRDHVARRDLAPVRPAVFQTQVSRPDWQARQTSTASAAATPSRDARSADTPLINHKEVVWRAVRRD